MKIFQEIQENRESFQKNILLTYLNFLEFQIFDIFWTYSPPIFLYHVSGIAQQKIKASNLIFGVFRWNNFKSSIILTKSEIISKSQWNQKYFSKSHLWCAWTRNVVESWYFWQIRPWNSHGLLVFMENPFFEL